VREAPTIARRHVEIVIDSGHSQLLPDQSSREGIRLRGQAQPAKAGINRVYLKRRYGIK